MAGGWPMKARHHPLKWRFRDLTSLSEAIAPGDYYRAMDDEDLVDALNLGLLRAGAHPNLRFTVVRGDGDVPIAELQGLGSPWLGPPQEAFFRLAELGEAAGPLAVEVAFASNAPRADHSGEPRFEQPQDDHRPRSGWRSFLRKEREAR